MKVIMKNKLILFLFFILVLCSFTFAIKPSTTVSTNFGIWNIETPAFDYFELGEKLNLHYHVFNDSGILQTNRTASCDFHLYNQSNHIMKKRLRFDNEYDFETDDIMGNITNAGGIGVYSYIVQCNNSKEGGYAERSFVINLNGEEEENETEVIGIYQFIVIGSSLLLLMFIFLFGIATYFKKGMEWVVVVISNIFSWTCLVVLFLIIMISSDLNISIEITDLLQTFFTIGIWLCIGYSLLCLVLFIYVIINNKRKIKQKENEDYQ